MRLTRLRLQNIRTFADVELSDLPAVTAFVSPNGIGKSTILEAITGAHELVSPYSGGRYQHLIDHEGQQLCQWPNHLRPPVTLGQKGGEIEIEVTPSAEEMAQLAVAGLGGQPATARFVLRAPRIVVEHVVSPALKALFSFHKPEDGFGYVDYTRPIRFYPNLGVGNASDTGTEGRVRQVFSEFNRGLADGSKFSDFKTFVVTATLNDATARQETGADVDSLHLFKEVFDRFFAPKRFMGPKIPGPGQPIEMLVRTPLGDHDTDLLSDGEKEILFMLAHLYQYRHLASIVLWDTPEANLNARLEARLSEALRQIAPRNQYILATHGLELIDSLPEDSIYTIRSTSSGAVVERLGSDSRKARTRLYLSLGARVGLQAVSSAIVFVEGKDSRSDKRYLDRLLRAEFPSVNCVAGGDCDTILALGSRANALLEQATTNGDFMSVVDRDYRTDDDVDAVEHRYQGRVFMWRCHEIENLFLDPDLTLQVLSHADQLGSLTDAPSVTKALTAVAQTLTDWIAADWVRWEIHTSLARPSGRISADSPLASLVEYGSRVNLGANAEVDSAAVTRRFEEKRKAVMRLLMSQAGVQRLPGKQLLAKFLAVNAPAISPDMFMSSAVSIALEGCKSLPEIERLKATLKAIMVADRSAGLTAAH